MRPTARSATLNCGTPVPLCAGRTKVLEKLQSHAARKRYWTTALRRRQRLRRTQGDSRRMAPACWTTARRAGLPLQPLFGSPELLQAGSPARRTVTWRPDAKAASEILANMAKAHSLMLRAGKLSCHMIVAFRSGNVHSFVEQKATLPVRCIHCCAFPACLPARLACLAIMLAG